MAKVTFSALISGLRGKTGDVVFSIWKGQPYVRSLVIPSNPQTAAQTAQRTCLANCLTMWQSIKAWAKAIWDPYGTAYGMSGYNGYMDLNMEHLKALEAGHLTPYNRDCVLISGMGAAAGAAGEIDLTWTNDSGVGGDTVQAYYRKTEAAAEEYAWTAEGVWGCLAEAGVMTGLDTGEEYEIGFFATDTSASLSQEAYNEVLVAG